MRWRWESEYRWYEAELMFDLFGDLLLIQRWGGLNNHRHGEKTALMPDFLTGVAQLHALNRNVAPLQGERHGSAVPMVFMP